MRVRRHATILGLTVCCLLALRPVNLDAADPQGIELRVDAPTQRLEMVVNSSRILTLDQDVPRTMVDNTSIVRVVPLSPNQLQVAALRPGVTQINIFGGDGRVFAVDVVVFADARELQMLLESEFPNASLRVRPLTSSVVLSGYVDRAEDVSRIVRMAEEYYPRVINNIVLGGVHQVLLHVKVLEVSRSKLRQAGIDWAFFGSEGGIGQQVSGVVSGVDPIGGGVASSGTETLSFAVLSGDLFASFLQLAREQNLVKVLAEPTILAESGRAATFHSGGEFPVIIPQGLGTVAVEFKQFGTRVDFVPFVVGNGVVKLQVRPIVSEVDDARAVTIEGTRIPGLRTRSVDTAVELRAGQTLALAGLIQERTVAQNRGLPYLADLPFFGIPFRKVVDERTEVELLVLVRPELVDALDPHEVPACGPGQSTTSPSDSDLYFRGYIEVPNCAPGTPGAAPEHGGPLPPPDGSLEPYRPGWEESGGPAGPLPPPEASQEGPTYHGAPTAAQPSTSYGPYLPPNVSTRPAGQQAISPNSSPPIVGGLGYDVLDFKR